uniref:hypothetical protein n=1 Tax=Aeromonas hydrophila TaxID=644 RepID=UPI0021AC70F2|nr:hypothetical protein [Aeromonas hydrophila]
MTQREENQRRHPRPRAEYERGDGEKPAERTADCRADMAHHPDGVSAADRHEKLLPGILQEISAPFVSHFRSPQPNDRAQRVSERGSGIYPVSHILLTHRRRLFSPGSILWWQGQQITNNYTHLRQQEDTLRK